MGEEKTDHDLLVDIHAQVTQVCTQVSEHHKALHGNGSRGLKHDMVVLQTKVALIWWVGGVVAMAAITAAVTSIYQLLAK